MMLVIVIGIELVEYVEPYIRIHQCRLVVVVDTSRFIRSPMATEATRHLCGPNDRWLPNIGPSGVAKTPHNNPALDMVLAPFILGCSNNIARHCQQSIQQFILVESLDILEMILAKYVW